MGEYIATLEIKFDLNLTFFCILQMVMGMIFLAYWDASGFTWQP